MIITAPYVARLVGGSPRRAALIASNHNLVSIQTALGPRAAVSEEQSEKQRERYQLMELW